MSSVDERLDYESTHKKSALKFETKQYLLLGGGPANSSERVLKALSRQCLIPVGPDMFQLMDEVKSMMQYVFQTKNTLTVAGQTSGSGGNETIVTNLLDPGEKIIVATGGFWGECVVDMSRRYNLDVLPLRKPPGEIYTFEELEDAVKTHQAKVLFVTHGESTGGTLQKVEGLGPMCHKHDCLLAVDAVVSIAVDPLFVDRWEIDAVCAGSQKAVGAPPGLSLLTFSERAEKRILAKKVPPPYYLDMKKMGIYWKCFDAPRSYHYTLSSNMVAALREALAQICEEGLVQMWQRHERTAQLFWKRLSDIGLECFVKKPENRFHGVICVTIPPKVDQMQLLKFLREKYAIDITPGHGPTLGVAIRVGLLGENSSPVVVEYLIKALEDGVNHLKKNSGKSAL